MCACYAELCRTDIFVGSQHKSPELPQEWWAQTFRQAVARIGHTLLVLQPWHAPMPLQRSWCLWEIFATLDSGVRLEVVLPPAEEGAFAAAILARPEAILKAMSTIDTRRAAAFFEADRAKIEAAVRASAGGFEAVNGRIHDRLRAWLVEQARALAARTAAARGDADAETLTARSRLAGLLQATGGRGEALEVITEVLRGRRKTLGPTHADTLQSAAELGFHLYLAGRCADGAAVCEAALAACGDAHAAAPALQNSLALCCMELGRSAEAEPLLLAVLAARRAQHGALHTATMGTLNNLGLLYAQSERLDEAKEAFTELLRCRVASDGHNHPDTLCARQNLGELLSERREHAAALATLTEVLRARRELQGAAHADTVAALCTLGDAQRQAGAPADAVAALRPALESARRDFGAVSSPARLIMRCLARALQAAGAAAEAEPLHAELLRQRVQLFGATAPFARESRADLAACLRQLGRHADAARVEAEDDDAAPAE
jgi:tetratricopeptide (TPR) repeat protein